MTDAKDWSAFFCLDCGQNTSEHDGGLNEYYMVHKDVWFMSGIAPDGGMLCIGCLEKRIGRRLKPSDFPPVFINGYGSLRMMNRLGYVS